MARVKRKRCPICGELVDPQGIYGHFKLAHPDLAQNWSEWKEKFDEVEVEEVEREQPPKREQGDGSKQEGPGERLEELPPPPEVRVIEEALEFLEERLPKVYGIEKYDKLIISSLRDNPAPLANPNALHAFIKSLAPRAHDSHLSVFVISPLYARFPNLPEAVAKLMASGYAAPPYYAAPHAPYHQPLYAPYPMHPANPVPAYVPAAHPVYYHHPIYYIYYPPPYYYYPPPPPKPPRTYKIIVDGQEIETDEAGFLAWQRFLQERRERELEMRKIEIEMKKLELEMKRMEREEERKREDELSRRVEKLAERVEQQAERLAQEKEDKFKMILSTLEKTQTTVMEMLKAMQQTERTLLEEKHKAEMEALRREIEELKRRPGFVEELEHYMDVARRLGMSRTGRTAYDLLESLFDRIDQRFAQLISRIPPPQQGWSPRVTRSPTERARLAEETIRRLERAEELVELENEMLRLAAEIAAEQSARSARAERRSSVTEAATGSEEAAQPSTGEAGGGGGVSGGGEEARATITA